MKNTMTFLDFFSGVGGFRYGLEQCGMKCIGHCEIDKYADRSYRAMFDMKEEWYANDITQINPADLPRANLWTAGFPCQDISVSGAMRGLVEGKRSSLFFEIIRLLESKNTEDRPEWLILENVKNLLSINKGWDFTTVLHSLAALGYNIEYGLLNSKFHGVPQNRERVYIVAYRHFRAEPGRKVFPVTAGDGKALIQLIGGTQGNRVYDPRGVGCTITSAAGGFGGKSGLYFVDLCKGKPKLTETARCIKARYDSGITNRGADNSGVFCLSDECKVRENETSFIKFQRGNPELQENSNCIIGGYTKVVISNYGESSGVFYGCRAVLTPDRENKRQNGRRMKDCGEPAFCLSTQDKHGVYLCACDTCGQALKIKEATKAGYKEAYCGDCVNFTFPDSKTRRGRVGKGEANTLDTACNQGAVFAGCGRIRRLTPRETWRLQGFPDFLFEKAAAVNSDNQLYRQAGNGVTTTVVYAVGQRILAIQTELDAERSKIT
jgi:DNA (cytosine-5)-methyltransferase 1